MSRTENSRRSVVAPLSPPQQKWGKERKVVSVVVSVGSAVVAMVSDGDRELLPTKHVLWLPNWNGDDRKMGNIKNISELLPDEPIKDPFEDEIHFNNTVREYIVSVSFFIFSVLVHLYHLFDRFSLWSVSGFEWNG